MSQEEFLTTLAAVLEAAGVPYVVTGSVATALYGEPRFTQDVDLVVIAPPGLGARIAAAFPPPRYYAPAPDIDGSLRAGIIANIIDSDEGIKVDLHPKRADPFSDSFFQRRRRLTLAGVELWFPSPEDAILSKLQWARATGDGERHLRDAAAVYAVQRETLDTAYVDVWAARLGVADLLTQIKSRAKDWL